MIRKPCLARTHPALAATVASHAARWAFFCVALIVLAGCESKTDTTSTTSTIEDVADSGELPLSVASEAPLEDDSAYPLPKDADAATLVQFISDVVMQEPKGATDEEKTADLGRQMDARIRAADRLKQIAETDDHKLTANRAKLESLRVLAMIGRENGREAYADYARALVSEESAELSQLGRLGQFRAELDEFLSLGKADASTLIADLESLLSREEANMATMVVAEETGDVLQRIGLAKAAGSAYQLLGEKFADNEDENLAKAAESALAQSNLLQLGDAFRKTMMGEPNAAADLLTLADKALEGEEIAPHVILPMVNIVQNLEFSGKTETATEFYSKLDAASQRVNDENARKQVSSVVSDGLRRVNMIGDPFEIEGQTPDGETFSWADYEGKVVLVDFWATWCGPCLGEIPNMKENYERFRDAGFEIVGVNLDEERERVTQFLEKNELPWTTVVSADDSQLGFADPNAKRYSVTAIPFLVLVGADGNVDSLHLRGPLLTQRLESLFPDVPGDGAAETADDSDADGDVEMELDEGETSASPTEAEEEEMEETETLPATDPDPLALDTISDVNPYLADADLSPNELTMYLLELADKPNSVQKRPGFRDAIVDTAERILAESKKKKHQQLAAEKKLEILHRDACWGDEAAQEQLTTFVGQLDVRAIPALTDAVAFFHLEARALRTDAADSETSVEVVKDCCEFLASQGEALDLEHLRLASRSVELVNELPGDDREPYFEKLSAALVKSEAREVKRYGKRLAAKPQESSALVGKTMELTGLTVDGGVFDLEHYRQQVIVVDFWATWCGPCRRAHKVLAELASEYEQVRFVGVSVDTDEKALLEYLDEHTVAGVTMFGKEAQQAADEYGARAIPYLIVVDAEGVIRHVTHSPDDLENVIRPLLETQLAESE